MAEPTIIPRSEHNVSRSDISNAALKVLYGLKDAGFRACLVGGGVRDLLLGFQPKDFDVATNASPEQVQAVFGRQARLIGRRFRIVHVRFGREIIEVSTFRADVSEADMDDVDDALHQRDDAGRILRDNVYGDIEQDARRRDFTINGLYYDIDDFSVYDYAEGMVDIEARRLRLIGDPAERYREDPVRMLRAVRISTKLGLAIEAETAAPIPGLTALLQDVPAARLFDEVLKLIMIPEGATVFDRIREYGLLAPLFPATAACLEGPNGEADEALIRQAISNTAERMRIGKPVTPAFLYAALLWAPVRERRDALRADHDMSLAQAQTMAQSEVLSEQARHVSIPKRFSGPMREMWQMQPRFHRRRGKAPARLMAQQRFRAAYDFLLLRAAVGEESQELAQWWTDIQAQDQPPKPPPSGKRRRRRRGGRKRRGGGNQNTAE